MNNKHFKNTFLRFTNNRNDHNNNTSNGTEDRLT